MPPGSPAPSAEVKKDEVGKKEGDDKKKEGEPKKEEPAKPAVIERPSKPETAPDPRELELVPTADGKVRFNFSGQPWPDVLQWLARVSSLSLDWQELPADYLNLRTQREYTLDEAQDLINRHLLARGFTLLRSGEMLTVVNISKINAALVPRVAPEELDQRQDHEFAKVSFPLKWMLAERAVEELKPMLSPNGKLTALKEINRVEALDAVVNLRDIHRLLQQTQSDDVSKNTVVREFRLQHRRAADVVLLVESILGLDKNRMPANVGRGSGDMMSAQIMMQLQQMQQIMQQQRGGQPAQGGGKPQEEEPKLIVNDRENSILAHATPDKMEIIEQTIKAIDVPGHDENQLLHQISRVKPYRVSSADPQAVVMILKEMGNLSPQSKIQVDDKTKSIILFGSLADHFTVQSLLERLDGSSRNFEVVSLRRLRADAVAGTIQYLLGAEEDDKNKNNNSSRYFYYGYGSNSSSRSSDKDERPFKVDADIINNRLLLWANEVELQEVHKLLVKMGEVAPGTKNQETLRAFDLSSDEEADQLLQRLRKVWPEIEPNQLQIQELPATPDREKSAPARPSAGPRTGIDPPLPGVAGQSSSPPLRLAWWDNGGGSSAGSPRLDDAGPGGADRDDARAVPVVPEEDLDQLMSGDRRPVPPITIQRLPNGRIVFSSPDTQALDRLEDMLNELAPPPKEYKVFQLKYPTTWAYGIELILKDFFDDSSNKETTYDPWWGTTTTKVNRSQRLSRRKELKIISDEDSHTILVQGATDDQLAAIQDLIDIYDRPASNDPQAIRKTEVFTLEYSKAPIIADTVKQVYRDLLSANDPALQNPNQQQKPSNEPTITYVYGNRQNNDDKDSNPAQPIKFKGLLSVGIDEVSNTIVVSAAEGLLADIRDLIHNLDQAARPTKTVQVLQVQNISPGVIQQRLERTFGEAPVVRSSETGQRSRNKPPQDANPMPPVQNGEGSGQNSGGGNNNGNGNR